MHAALHGNYSVDLILPIKIIPFNTESLLSDYLDRYITEILDIVDKCLIDTHLERSPHMHKYTNKFNMCSHIPSFEKISMVFDKSSASSTANFPVDAS